MSIEDRLARAREDKREKDFVAKRLAETRADRVRVQQHLEVTQQLLANEQEDVDRLTKGVGGFFRRITASREDLTREQRELEAAKLQHEALEEELEAIEVDLAQLCEREAKVADADRRYAAALAEREAEVVRAGSPHAPQLAALGDSEARLRDMCKEVGEAIDAGRIAHDHLASVQISASSNNRAAYAAQVGTGLGGGVSLSFGSTLGGLTSEVAGDIASAMIRERLRGELGNAQHALLRYQRECRDVSPASGVQGVDLPELPSLNGLIAREIVWSNYGVVEDIYAHVSQLASLVAQSVMELRGRASQLEKALADIGEQRASLLDPRRDRL